MFDKTDLQRIATAAVGALVLSAACIVGAAGPVRAAERQGEAGFVACAAPISLTR